MGRDDEMETRYPEIPWREPVEMVSAGDLGADSVSQASALSLKTSISCTRTTQEFNVHMAQFHPPGGSG
jgi:hypothetical protein